MAYWPENGWDHWEEQGGYNLGPVHYCQYNTWLGADGEYRDTCKCGKAKCRKAKWLK